MQFSVSAPDEYIYERIFLRIIYTSIKSNFLLLAHHVITVLMLNKSAKCLAQSKHIFSGHFSLVLLSKTKQNIIILFLLGALIKHSSILYVFLIENC